MASRHLHPHRVNSDGAGEQHEPYQLTNPETARLLGLQCGTYFISKDERKLLEEDAVDSAAHLSQMTSHAITTTTTTTIAVGSAQPVDVVVPTQDEDDAQMKADSAAAAASKLWEELEEAAHLPPTAGVGGEPGMGGGSDGDQVDDDAVDSELMQVDEIVNQVVEDQTGSQAPSPL